MNFQPCPNGGDGVRLDEIVAMMHARRCIERAAVGDLHLHALGVEFAIEICHRFGVDDQIVRKRKKTIGGGVKRVRADVAEVGEEIPACIRRLKICRDGIAQFRLRRMPGRDAALEAGDLLVIADTRLALQAGFCDPQLICPSSLSIGSHRGLILNRKFPRHQIHQQQLQTTIS